MSVRSDEAWTPAEAFPPGEYIQDELNARGWDRRELARRSGLPFVRIDGLIGDIIPLIPEDAIGLHKAFGVSAQCWINHETAYRGHVDRSQE